MSSSGSSVRNIREDSGTESDQMESKTDPQVDETPKPKTPDLTPDLTEEEKDDDDSINKSNDTCHSNNGSHITEDDEEENAIDQTPENSLDSEVEHSDL